MFTINDDWKELFEERAAIMEYDGGMTREEAERSAYLDILKLMKKGENKDEVSNDKL